MAIPTYNFTIKKGNTGIVNNVNGLQVVFKDSNGDPIDLTGSEIIFFAKWNGAVNLRKTSGDGGVTVVALSGQITVPFAIADFSSVAANTQISYEIEKRDTPDQVTVLQGRITLESAFNDD